LISGGTLRAKASIWAVLDTDGRKLGERKGLETPVVLAVNNVRYPDGSEQSVLLGVSKCVKRTAWGVRPQG